MSQIRVQQSMEYSICVYAVRALVVLVRNIYSTTHRLRVFFVYAAQSHRKGINGFFLIFKTKTYYMGMRGAQNTSSMFVAL